MHDKKIVQMSKERLSICQTNQCRYYDAKGRSEIAVVKGKPACGICGCNLHLLTSLPDSICSLQELNKQPLWGAKEI